MELEFRDVTKQYGKVKAVNEINWDPILSTFYPICRCRISRIYVQFSPNIR